MVSPRVPFLWNLFCAGREEAKTPLERLKENSDTTFERKDTHLTKVDWTFDVDVY